jgi:thiol-disulfide isomerase/thioredoxin
MNTLILLLALAILVILVYRVWEPFVDTPKQPVPVGSATLYFFYTDWCGFSQKAMPEWEKVEAVLKETPVFGKTKVTAVRVNGDEDRKTTALYEVDGFPMIKLETSSLLAEFDGPRTVDGIVKFLRTTLGKEGKSL